MMQGYLRRKLPLLLLTYSSAAMLVWLWHGLKTEESRSSTRELGQEEQEGTITAMDTAGGEVSPVVEEAKDDDSEKMKTILLWHNAYGSNFLLGAEAELGRSPFQRFGCQESRYFEDECLLMKSSQEKSKNNVATCL